MLERNLFSAVSAIEAAVVQLSGDLPAAPPADEPKSVVDKFTLAVSGFFADVFSIVPSQALETVLWAG